MSFRAGKALGGVAVAHATGYLAAMGWTWFLARHVPLDDFGYLNWMLATTLLFQVVFGFGFYQGLLRYVPRLVGTGGAVARRRLYARSQAGVLLATTATLVIVLAYFAMTGSPGVEKWVLVVICAIGGAWLSTAGAYLQSLGRAAVGAFVATALLPLAMGLVLIAITIGGGTSGYLLLQAAAAVSLVVGAGAAGGVLLVARRHAPQGEARFAALSPDMRLEYLAFCGRAMLITLVYQGLASLDRIMLGLLGPLGDVGLYHFPAKLVSAMTFIVYLFPPIVGPVFARYLESARPDIALAAYRTSSTLAALATIPIALVFATAGAPLLQMLAGPQFAVGAPILAVLAFGTAAVTITGNNGLLLQMGGRQGAELASSVAALGLNVALNFVLIPRYGPLGAAVATTASLLASTVAKVVMCHRYWRVLPYNRHSLAIAIGSLAFIVIWLAMGWWTQLHWVWRTVAALAGYVCVTMPWRLRHDLGDLLGSAADGASEC